MDMALALALAKASGGGGGGGGDNLVVLTIADDQLDVSAKDLIGYAKAGKAVVLPLVNDAETNCWNYWLGWVGYYTDDSKYEAKFISHNSDIVTEAVFESETETGKLVKQ